MKAYLFGIILIFTSITGFSQTNTDPALVELNETLSFIVDSNKQGVRWLYEPVQQNIYVFGEQETKVFDAAGGKELRTLPLMGNVKGQTLYSISPDGTKFVSYSLGKREATLWNLENGKRIASIKKIGKAFVSVKWSSNSKFFILENFSGVRQDKEHQIWDSESGQSKYSIKTKHNSDLLISADSKLILTREYDIRYRRNNLLTLWEADNGRMINEIPTENSRRQFMFGFFTPDSSHVVTVLKGEGIYFYDAATNELKNHIETGKEQPRDLEKFEFSPDGKLMLVGRSNFRFFKTSERWFDVYDMQTLELKHELRTDRPERLLFNYYHLVLWSHDGKTLISAGGRPGSTYEAEAWDEETGKSKFVLSPLIAKKSRGFLEGGFDYYDIVHFWHDDRYLLTHNGGKENTLRIWDAETGRLLKNIDSKDSNFVITSDNRFIYEFDERGKVTFYTIQ